MTTAEQILIVLREIKIPNLFSAKLWNNGIIEVTWDNSLLVVNAEILEKLTEAFGELGGGTKMPVYFSSHAFMDLTDDGKEYARSTEGQRHTLANAVLIDNLGKKIIYNFFIKFYRPTTSTRAFQSKDLAFEWLLTHHSV